MIKLGIIGTGRIAKRFFVDAKQVQEVLITAVYNPNFASAEAFATDKENIVAYDNLSDFLKVVEAVYIASPHNTHFSYAKSALEEGVNVLCEKPMCLKADEVKGLYDIAAKKGLIIKEAVKTAYCEGFRKILQVVAEGRIGRVRDVEACFTRLTPTNGREYLDVDCGGSMTELASYVLLPIMKLMGTDYTNVSFQSVYAPNGVDNYTKINLTYKDGMATGRVGLGVKSEGQLLISGTKGYILAESPWWLTKHFQVRYEDPKKIEEYDAKFEGSGLQYELAAFVAQILDEHHIKNGSVVKQKKNSGDVENLASVHANPHECWYHEIGVSQEESLMAAGIIEKYLSEQSDRRKNTSTADKQKTKIWAHRGCSYAYPENTLEAFEAAAKLSGIKGIELDVQFTKDKEVVVFHDENVARVTNGDRRVCEYTLIEIKQLKVAPGTEKESQIPTLDEVLTLLKPYCENNGLLINIELKTSIIRYEGIEEATLELVRKHGLEKYIVYSSFLMDSVRLIKQLDHSVVTGMLASNIEDCMYMGMQADADALHPWMGGLTMQSDSEWKDKPVRIWGGGEPFYTDGKILHNRDLRDMVVFGATDLITNVPEKYL